MYVSYTSTVGQYRTYPLGFTHNHIAWEPEPSEGYMYGPAYKVL